MTDHLDFLASTLDEIALEGLDGITIGALWLRLAKRPNFPLALDENSKSYIWECLKCCEDITVYLLAEPRGQLDIYNRFDHVDPDQDILREPDVVPVDIYPVVVIDDVSKGIRGSCCNYETRQEITNSFKAWSLQEAVEQYANYLILVASQSLRNKTLFGCNVNPAKDLTAKEYVMLERIGRSRYHGEITQGKQSLPAAMQEPIKSIFYHRKVLSKMGLITKQMFSQHNTRGQTSTGSLFHLPRFFIEYIPKSLYYIREGIRLLFKCDKNRMVAAEFVHRLGNPTKVRKVAKTPEFKQHIQAMQVPYREMYPEADEKEWKYKNTRHRDNPEKTVRVFYLGNPDGDHSSVFGYQDDLAADDDEDEETSGFAGILDDKNIVLNKSLLSQAYEFALRCGPNGCTQRDVGQYFGCNKLDARTLCRNLIKRDLVVSVMKDAGKQRVTRYVCKSWAKVSHITKELLEQKQKLLDQLRSPTVTQPLENNSILPTDDNSASTYETPEMTSTGDQAYVHDLVNYLPNENNSPKKLSHFHMDNPGASLRVLKRANLVLEHVKEHKVTTTMDLMKYLNDTEKNEGVESKMDRKSLFRVLKKLESDGYIKNFKIFLKYGNKERSIQLVTEFNVKKDDEALKLIIEQEKLKLFMTPQLTRKNHESTWNKSLRENSQNSDGWSDLPESLKESAMQNIDKNDETQTAPVVYSPGWGRLHGYLPKFSRMEVMHHLLFYLVYDYTGNPNLHQEEELSSIAFNLSYGSNLDLTELPKVYHEVGGWKMFIPPLPKHEGYCKGWILYSDILLRIPLSIFAQCVLINYKISGLEEYLEHPIKKHLLLCQLPAPIRHAIVMDQKYKFTIFEVIQNLSFIGLVQLGPRVLKRKEMVFFYINKHAVIHNTSVSQPGMHQITKGQHYPRLSYTFAAFKDLDNYWCDFNRISQSTPLGKWLPAVGQKIIVIPPMKKPELIGVLKSVTVEEAPGNDKGYLPGDKLGAACTDSSLFAYRRDNWVVNGDKKQRKLINSSKSEKRDHPFVEHLKSKYSGPSGISVSADDQVGIPFIFGKRKRRKLSEETPIKKSKVCKREKIEYTVTKRSRKKQKPRVDEMDEKALKLKTRCRFSFTSDEDTFLLICKSALLYLFGSDLLYDHTKTRDIFNKMFPESLKTTSTLQRRMNFMMKSSPNVSHTVALIVGSLRQDDEVTEKFGDYVNKAKTKKEGLEVINDVFEDLIMTIQQKFKQAGGLNNMIQLPDSIDSFRSKFSIHDPTILLKKNSFKEVQNVVDIHASMVRTVIISSLCSFGDKTNWTYHVFWIYLQYPDSLLRSVMAKLKDDEMVSLKKKMNMVKNSGTKTFLPLSSSPYKLSFKFQKCLTSIYQYWTYSQAYLVFKKLLSDSNDGRGVDLSKFNFGGNSALVLELISTKRITLDIDIPDHVLYLDTSSCSKEIMTSYWFTKILVKSGNAGNQVQSNKQGTSKTGEGQTSDCKIDISRQAVLYMQEDEQGTNAKGTKHSETKTYNWSLGRYIEIHSCSVFGRLTDDLIAFENDPDRSLHLIPQTLVNQLVLTKVNFILQEDSLTDIEKIIRTKGYGEAELASVRDLYTLIISKKEIGAKVEDLKRAFPVVNGRLRIYHLLDYLIKGQLVVRSGTVEFHYIASKFSKPWLISTYKMKRAEREKVQTCEAKLYEPKDEPNPCELPVEINVEGEGVGGKRRLMPESSEINTRKMNKRLKKMVMGKEEKEYINNLGQKRNESVWISIRPWIRVDGTMNRRVLDTFLGSTLGYIMQHPGSTAKQISHHMAPSVFPVHVAELLEMLEKIGCVTSEKFIVQKTGGFFGEETLIFVGDDMTDEQFYNHVVAYEAAPDAVTRMGYFIGDKKYLVDFLDSLIF